MEICQGSWFTLQMQNLQFLCTICCSFETYWPHSKSGSYIAFTSSVCLSNKYFCHTFLKYYWTVWFHTLSAVLQWWVLFRYFGIWTPTSCCIDTLDFLICWTNWKTFVTLFLCTTKQKNFILDQQLHIDEL